MGDEVTGRADHELIAALQDGDEATFRALVEFHSPALVRVAGAYVRSRAVAEEVVQETWLGVLQGLDRFEGRSSLKTWLYGILTNCAMARARKEGRSVPFSALAAAEAGGGEPSVDPDRFLPADHDRFAGHWALAPARWATPEERLLAGETRGVILAAIERLPDAQRTVIALRDIEGWPAEEVCAALGISEGNQRVLLHRARARVRAALEDYHGAVERPGAGV
jgi:RNA polymerase sigma-70 factor, ECF subfamily